MIIKNLWTLNFYFIDSQNYSHIIGIFLNHIKIETLDEIATSLENLWQQMIQLSEFFQYSFVLIPKRKCLVRASRVRSGESGTPSTIIYTRWSSRRYELGCDTPVTICTICAMTFIKVAVICILLFSNKLDLNLIWTLQWSHNGHDNVSNPQPHDYLLNRLFRR